MATDWNFMRQRFPGLPENPTYEDVLNAGRRECDGKTVGELAELYADVEARKRIANQVITGINAEAVAIEGVIIGRLEDQGADSMKLAKGGSIRIDRTLDAKIDPDGGKERLREWIVKNDMSELLSVHGQTLSSECRKWFQSGQELPDGVELVPRNALRLTGRK